MQETELFEEILKLQGNSFFVSLKSLDGESKSKIVITPRGEVDQSIIEGLIDLTKKRGANLSLISYGVMEITF